MNWFAIVSAKYDGVANWTFTDNVGNVVILNNATIQQIVIDYKQGPTQ